LAPPYWSATDNEIDGAVLLAASAFPAYRAIPRRWRAEFLRQIATDLEYLREDLVERMVEETPLLRGRVRAERDRTSFQLRFFAGLVKEHS
jgi:NADP-dependent aldehyde dehydrogenase